MKNEKVLMSIDSGSTSVRCTFINQSGSIIGFDQQEISQIYPKKDWVEHNAIEILNSQITAIRSAKEKGKIQTKNILAAGITNQRETIVLWDKKTGAPCYNAIAWQDKRTAKYCEDLKKEGLDKLITEKTGLIINPYFSATKIKWVLDNVPKAKYLIEKKRLMCGTIDSWLLWNLTGGKSFYTDVSNASRTMLLNINTLDWDDELLKLFNIPREILPKIKDTSDDFGSILPSFFSTSATNYIPVNAIIGDQQSSLFGLHCFKFGDVKTTYGTGCFALMNIGNKPICSKNKLLVTLAWKLKNQNPTYALEGSVFIGGAAINWLRDDLRIIYRSDESEYYASISQNANNIYVVPSFVGLGAPYWDNYSRGAIFGLERNTNREDIITATLNSIAYQCNDLIKTMEKDVKLKIRLLNVDGGVSYSKYLMQFQSNISNIKINNYVNKETTSLGVLFIVGLYNNFWNKEDIKKINNIKNIFSPTITDKQRKKLINGWDEAVKRTLNWKKCIEE